MIPTLTRPPAARPGARLLFAVLSVLVLPAAVQAAPEHRPGGEVNLQLPSLAQGSFFGLNGHQFLLGGLVVCVLGLLFGLVTYLGVRKLPVHRSMAEISELIYETCKAYLVQQGRFLLILEVFIGTVIVAYFWLIGFPFYRIAIIHVFNRDGLPGRHSLAC